MVRQKKLTQKYPKINSAKINSVKINSPKKYKRQVQPKTNKNVLARKEYTRDFFHEIKAKTNPFSQFKLWYQDALNEPGIVEANAMALATTAKSGQTSIRMLLLKKFDQSGFIFFTNYRSKKGKEIELNNRVALLFYWPILERQVRLEGSVSKISRKESLKYFKSRPVGAQIGANISPQSQVIKDRKVLEEAYVRFAESHKNTDIPLPVNWGGYRLTPNYFEFWQGRQDRLHDRLVYKRLSKKKEHSAWKML